MTSEQLMLLIQIIAIIPSIIFIFLKLRSDFRKYYEIEKKEREDLIHRINDLKIKIIELETKLNHLSGNFKMLSNSMKSELDGIHIKDVDREVKMSQLSESINSKFENFAYILKEIKEDIAEIKHDFKEHCKSENNERRSQ